jgi:formamidopyrimidine-DNA glycosylase
MNDPGYDPVMPELPDITVYVEGLDRLIRDELLEGISLKSPFVLRSVEPAVAELCGRRVVGVSRLGKRIVIALVGDLFVVIHLMIAGRLRWHARGASPSARGLLAAFDFSSGTLALSEVASKKRAALHLVRGANALADLDPGGLEVIGSPFARFAAVMTRENRTLKRALTDPRILSGIGNTYSDEILHRARMSPFALTQAMTQEELRTLHAAAQAVLGEWTERLRAEAGDGLPAKVTAFHEGMAVHGRYGLPCPDCGAPVQRIAYADREANYCARCQTGDRLLADRALSRLLKRDWPKTLDELEQRRTNLGSA